MQSFLEQIVERYTQPSELGCLARYCFVFPNRRAATFFRRYIIDRLDQIDAVAFLPAMTNMGALTSRFGQGARASEAEQLFALYNVYRTVCDQREVKPESVMDFDTFRFWGQMIVRDFEEIDREMADPSQLLRNIKDLNEIKAVNYLTEEQREVICHFWSLEQDAGLTTNDPEQFWQHTHQAAQAEVAKKFTDLWGLLEPMYHAHRRLLKERGLYTAGMAARRAAKEISAAPHDCGLQFKRYIFVGFNALTKSEMCIFRKLKDAGMADFYWDFDCPAFFTDAATRQVAQTNKATRFLAQSVKSFPSLYPLDTLPERAPGDELQIDIIGVPSTVGQTKAATQVLQKWLEPDHSGRPAIRHGANAIDTAIVVHDESMLIPLMHSIPPQISNVNITLEMPTRHWPAASLISTLTKMQMQARSGKFFYEHVLGVTSHPLAMSLAPDECATLSDYITEKRAYTLESHDLQNTYPTLAPLFANLERASGEAVFQYYHHVLSTVAQALDADQNTPKDFRQQQIQAVARLVQIVDQLQQLCLEYGVEINRQSAMTIIEHNIDMDVVGLSGNPLLGLQVLSMNETRALDFDNIIMLSMNERIFPRRSYLKTFIPMALRHDAGLTTIDDQESNSAYYFYRLLTRARRVTLLYDSRQGITGGGEMSRYLFQLQHFCHFPKVNFLATKLTPSTPGARQIEIQKDLSLLAPFRPDYQPADERRYISASALKSLKKCSLRFYLQKVCRWNEDSDMKNYVDEAGLGTILHDTLKELYQDSCRTRGTQLMDVAAIEVLQHDQRKVKNELRRQINIVHNHISPKSPKVERPLEGDTALIAETLLATLNQLFEEEKKQAPFDFVEAEQRREIAWQVDPADPETAINFVYIIDRVDRHQGKLRIIDYKTGADTLEADLDKMFTADANDAVYQLLLYCCAYADQCNTDEPMQPMIYKLRTIHTDGLNQLSIKYAVPGKKRAKVVEPLTDYLPYRQQFLKGFATQIRDLFDPTKPFTQATDVKHCKFCPFTDLCGRNPR